MQKVDHIIIETTTPQESAKKIADEFELPFAWKLLESDEYTSVGINFGDINFEFIDFKKKRKKPVGFSGIAFRIDDEVKDFKKFLKSQEFDYKIIKKCEEYTTISVEDKKMFPSVYFTKYNQDAENWKDKLKKEFEESKGGKYSISKFVSFNMKKNSCNQIIDNFNSINTSQAKNSVIFTTNQKIAKPIIVQDLIENLEIIFI